MRSSSFDVRQDQLRQIERELADLRQSYCERLGRDLLKAILRLFIYKALYDQSYLGSKTTMTTGEWSCLISFAWDLLTCSEGRGGSENLK